METKKIEVKIIATVTKTVGRKTEGIFEVQINGKRPNKYLPISELKTLSGVKRRNQINQLEAWLNTDEGRKWAILTPHVADF